MSLPALRIWIPGVPRPQGSLKIVTSASTGQAFAKNSDTTVAHRNSVVEALRSKWQGAPALSGPVAVLALFAFPRPKGHYGTGRNAGRLKASAGAHKTTPADTDKLARLVNDGITIAGIIRDDAQVVELIARKVFCRQPEQSGTAILIYELANDKIGWVGSHPLDGSRND